MSIKAADNLEENINYRNEGFNKHNAFKRKISLRLIGRYDFSLNN